MQDDDDDATDAEVDELPRLQVVVKSQDKQKEKGGSSSEKEEPQPEDVQAKEEEEEEVLPEIAPITKPEDRHGQCLVNSSVQHIKDYCMKSHSAHNMFSEVMTWKADHHYSVETSAILL